MKNSTLSNRPFSTLLILTLSLAFVATANAIVNAEVIEPEKTIRSKGYNSKEMGEDGKTMFYFRTERTQLPLIKSLEGNIAKLPKDPKILPVCNMLVNSALDKHGISFDNIFLGDYGYQGATIVCAIKYKRGNIIGTQLVYSKEADSEVFQVIIVD